MDASGQPVGLVGSSTGSLPFAGLPKESAWQACVSKVGDGDESALGVLYDETKSMVYGLALRLLGNPEDAEEVTLDVYAQVWKTAKSFNSQRGTVTAWLMLLTRSRSVDRIRARASRNRNTEPLPETAEIPARAATPEQASATGEQRRIVLEALSRLPSEQRRLLELAFFSDLTHTELASKLGEPLGTVKTRIRLGMMKLREYLGESGAQYLRA
jgi:RNA polymerase sigma-70 factor, ECF subfamily